jgi:hypothetical protein
MEEEETGSEPSNKRARCDGLLLPPGEGNTFSTGLGSIPLKTLRNLFGHFKAFDQRGLRSFQRFLAVFGGMLSEPEIPGF